MTNFICGALTVVAILCFSVATWAWLEQWRDDRKVRELDAQAAKKRLGTLQGE